MNETGDDGTDLTLCFASSLFTQTTVVPAAISRVGGLNAKFCIVIVAVGACATGDGLGEGTSEGCGLGDGKNEGTGEGEGEGAANEGEGTVGIADGEGEGVPSCVMQPRSKTETDKSAKGASFT